MAEDDARPPVAAIVLRLDAEGSISSWEFAEPSERAGSKMAVDDLLRDLQVAAPPPVLRDRVQMVGLPVSLCH